MNPNGGMRLHLPEPEKATVVALNEMQLVAMVAAHLYGEADYGQRENLAADAVSTACEIVAETVVQIQGGVLRKAVEAARARAGVNGE